MRKIESLVAVSVDATDLENATGDYERQVSRAVQSDPEVQAFVERLEEAAGPGHAGRSRPATCRPATRSPVEFQRFLRQQGPER